MNCPKCGVCLGVSSTPDGSPKYVCVRCEWESESVNSLVKASQACRLAELQAQGAEPGWYGPDGTLGKTIRLLSGEVAGVVWRDTFLHIAEARLCGFVEVPHD